MSTLRIVKNVCANFNSLCEGNMSKEAGYVKRAEKDRKR